MHDKIILNADEHIVCPKCSHDFSLGDGITRQTIDRHAEEFEALLQSRRTELERHLTQEAQRKATQLAAEQIAMLQEQVAAAKRSERAVQESIEKIRAEARANAVAETEQARVALEEDLQRKNLELQNFRAQELTLRRQKQELEEQQKNLELDLQRKLDEERARITAIVSQREAERFALMESEWKKKIEDAQKSNEDLRRKLEQGSQQLQGEVLELEVEQSLSTSFFHDLIEEVKKGVRGADVIQTVRTSAGIIAGRIIWEAKRAEHWSDKWLQKLKDDQQEAKAELAVLVTTVMPKGVTEPFTRIGDIWVISPQVLRPMAETLRVIILESHKLRQANVGRDEKIEQLYNYLASPTFAQRMRTVLDTFATLQAELESEKRAMQKIWARRQVQIDRASKSMTTVVGELQGITLDSIPGLRHIEALDELAAPITDQSADDLVD